MVKLKHAEERSSNQHISVNYSSDAGTDLSFLGEDWVIVKKQKVNILIPPLPSSSSNPVASNPTSEQLQDAVLRELDDNPVASNPTSEQLQDAVMRELDNNSASDSPAEKGSEEQLALVKDKPSSAILGSAPFSVRSCNPPNGVVAPVNHKITKLLNDPQQSSPQTREHLPKLHQSTRTHHGLRAVKQLRLSPMESKLSKMMKASNLERKLLRAGGLSRWLTSMGLEQFIRIFNARKVSKFQLVNLSMRKLKDMGINAVGPRRKLMHAIECICYPYCFEAS